MCVAAAAASCSSGRRADVWLLVHLPEAPEEPSNDCSRRLISCCRSPLRPARANVFFSSWAGRRFMTCCFLPCKRQPSTRARRRSFKEQPLLLGGTVLLTVIIPHTFWEHHAQLSCPSAEREHLVGGVGRGHAYATWIRGSLSWAARPGGLHTLNP